jgi:hypothetical protein
MSTPTASTVSAVSAWPNPVGGATASTGRPEWARRLRRPFRPDRLHRCRAGDVIEVPRHYPAVLEVECLSPVPRDGLVTLAWSSGPDCGLTSMSTRTRVFVIHRATLR